MYIYQIVLQDVALLLAIILASTGLRNIVNKVIPFRNLNIFGNMFYVAIGMYLIFVLNSKEYKNNNNTQSKSLFDRIKFNKK